MKPVHFVGRIGVLVGYVELRIATLYERRGV
jgi:hypothetical protein